MPSHGRRCASDDTLCDETTPLLGDPEIQKPSLAQPTPLPKAQLAALCAIRLADPIAFTQIFPYINEFITTFHLTTDPTRIGYYSGLVESSFAFAQLCSIYHWAKISDIIGRRPVIIAGTLGLALTTTLLGFSNSLSQLLLSRCLAGLFSGNVAVIHSVLGELTDVTNQATAFPIYGLFWPLGSIIGPLIGGSLSNAATKYPQHLDYPFLQTYPYFLPCFVASVLALFGVVLGYCCLEETLPSKRRQNNQEKQPSFSAGQHSTHAESNGPSVHLASPSLGMRELLSIPIIRALSASGCALSFISTAFDVVFVLFCYSPINAGGLAFSVSEIGYSLASAGTISAAIQLFIMPTLLRKFNTAAMYNFFMALWPFTFVALPFLNLVMRIGTQEGTRAIDPVSNIILWISIALVLACSRVACLAYSVSMVLVKQHAPNPATLGSTNGLVQFSMCLARAVSPAFVSSAFALSIKNNLLGGHLWVLIMAFISWGGCSMAKAISLNHKE